MMICPQCGYERKKGDEFIQETECPKCGIIYGKWKPVSNGNTETLIPESSGEVVSSPKTEKNISIERLVIYAGIVVVFIILLHAVVVPFAVKRFKHGNDEVQKDEPLESLNTAEAVNLENFNKNFANRKDNTPTRGEISAESSKILDAKNGSDYDSGYGTSAESQKPQLIDIFCYTDGNGQVFFVEWRTGMQVSRTDGTLDRVKYEKWVLEQIGGNPDNINPEKEARDDLERNREKLFKSVFPHRSMSDTNLTNGEKGWLERRYQIHYVDVYNRCMTRRNEAVRKYTAMMTEFERFDLRRKQKQSDR